MNNEVFRLLPTRLMQALICVRHADDHDMMPYQPAAICNRSSKSEGANRLLRRPVNKGMACLSCRDLYRTKLNSPTSFDLTNCIYLNTHFKKVKNIL